jgi:hypothetical protein
MRRCARERVVHGMTSFSGHMELAKGHLFIKTSLPKSDSANG